MMWRHPTIPTNRRTSTAGLILLLASVSSCPCIGKAAAAPVLIAPPVESESTPPSKDQPHSPPPEAVPDTITTKNGVTVRIPVLANDRPRASEGIELLSIGVPVNGAARRDGQEIVYAPNPGFSGRDTFSYTIADRQGRTATATVTVDVQPPTAPITRPDSASTREGEAVRIPVLNNDTDPEGSGLRVAAAGGGKLGEARVEPDQTVRYVPRAGASGRDSFTYTVVSGAGARATGVVTVDIAEVPKPPVLGSDRNTTMRDTPVEVAVLDNDHAGGGEPLKVTAVSRPLNGQASVLPDGRIRYTPNAGFVGTDAMEYTVRDARGLSATATLTIEIVRGNRPPVAVADVATVTAGAAVEIPVLANDGDPDGDTLSIVGVTSPSRGLARVVGDRVVYTADRTASNNDTFSYEVRDAQGATALATVTVQIKPANHPPVAAPDKAETTAGTPVTIHPLANDRDPDGDRLTLDKVGTPGHGQVRKGTDGTLVYVPAPGFTGVDRFDYTVADPGGLTATAVVEVTVRPPPVSCVDQVEESESDGIATIRVTNPCRAGQILKVTYDQWTCSRVFDGRGRAEFKGGLVAAETAFRLDAPDVPIKTVRLPFKDAERRVRIVLRWDAPVELDLHVFEPRPGRPHKDVHAWASGDRRLIGEGRVSTTYGKDTPDCRQEVYDLVPDPGSPQAMRRLKVAVDFADRQAGASAETCGGGRLAEPSYQLMASVFGRPVPLQRRTFKPIRCGERLTDDARFKEELGVVY